MPEPYQWDALSPEGVRTLFDGFDAPWWIAGGWAIDLFLGRQTREHGDIEVAILRSEQERLQRHLRDWDVHVAHGGELTPWAMGDWLVAPRWQFWVRRDADSAWAFEVFLEDSHEGEWLFRRDASIALPLERFGGVSAEGIPFVAPEVALLYKATATAPGASAIERNAQDFAVGAPALDADARAWLRDALTLLHPGHGWIDQLQ